MKNPISRLFTTLIVVFTIISLIDVKVIRVVLIIVVAPLAIAISACVLFFTTLAIAILPSDKY